MFESGGYYEEEEDDDLTTADDGVVLDDEELYEWYRSMKVKLPQMQIPKDDKLLFDVGRQHLFGTNF
jgi:hypothetical protein